MTHTIITNGKYKWIFKVRIGEDCREKGCIRFWWLEERIDGLGWRLGLGRTDGGQKGGEV